MVIKNISTLYCRNKGKHVSTVSCAIINGLINQVCNL